LQEVDATKSTANSVHGGQLYNKKTINKNKASTFEYAHSGLSLSSLVHFGGGKVI
jgi:hypothetical protein